jgi:hypothetical protein
MNIRSSIFPYCERCAAGGVIRRHRSCHPEATASSWLKDHLAPNFTEAAGEAFRKLLPEDPSVAMRLLLQDDKAPKNKNESGSRSSLLSFERFSRRETYC